MNEELIEHKVEIDKYISAIVRIPKVLNALELKFILGKVNKLSNISEVPIVTPIKTTRQYNKKIKLSGRKNRVYTPEMIDFIIRRKNSGDKLKQLTKNFNEKFNTNVSVGRLSRKVYYIKSHKQWDKKLMPVAGLMPVTVEKITLPTHVSRKRNSFSPEIKNRIRELVKEGNNSTQIYDILLNEKAIDSNLKKRSMIDLTCAARKELGING